MDLTANVYEYADDEYPVHKNNLNISEFWKDKNDNYWFQATYETVPGYGGESHMIARLDFKKNVYERLITTELIEEWKPVEVIDDLVPEGMYYETFIFYGAE